MQKNDIYQTGNLNSDVWFRTRGRWLRCASAALAIVATCPPLAAQKLLDIYPRHAVARTETRFTVEGVALPTEDSPNAGLKLSTVPAGSCENAKRYKAATSEHYYFACTFQASQTPVRIRIHNKTGTKSELVGSYTIPVLSGPPQINQVFVTGNVLGNGVRVRCEIGAVCATYAGDLAASDRISVEVKGTNLPPELYFEVQGCTQAKAEPTEKPESNEQQNEARQTSCTVAAGAASRKIRVLTAAPARGGNEIWQTDIGTANQ